MLLATLERVLCIGYIYICYIYIYIHTCIYCGMWNECSKCWVELRVILLAGGAALNPN
jgi:hypothetical protein